MSCIEKANIMRMTRIETMDRAYGIVSLLLILQISKLRKFIPIFTIPYKMQMKVQSSIMAKKVVSKNNWMLQKFSWWFERTFRNQSKGLKNDGDFSRRQPHLYPHSEFISLSIFVMSIEYTINKEIFKQKIPIATLNGVSIFKIQEMNFQRDLFLRSSDYILFVIFNCFEVKIDSSFLSFFKTALSFAEIWFF